MVSGQHVTWISSCMDAASCLTAFLTSGGSVNFHFTAGYKPGAMVINDLVQSTEQSKSPSIIYPFGNKLFIRDFCMMELCNLGIKTHFSADAQLKRWLCFSVNITPRSQQHHFYSDSIHMGIWVLSAEVHFTVIHLKKRILYIVTVCRLWIIY